MYTNEYMKVLLLLHSLRCGNIANKPSSFYLNARLSVLRAHLHSYGYHVNLFPQLFAELLSFFKTIGNSTIAKNTTWIWASSVFCWRKAFTTVHKLETNFWTAYNAPTIHNIWYILTSIQLFFTCFLFHYYFCGCLQSASLPNSVTSTNEKNMQKKIHFISIVNVVENLNLPV